MTRQAAAGGRTICVYCASSRQCHPAFHDAARRLGATLASAGFAIVYGVSDNRDSLWRNPDAERIGWRPRDSSERFRAGVDAHTPHPDPNDVQNRFHGGRFTQDGPFEDRPT